MKYINSPIQELSYQGFNFFIKRDDLLDIHFSGNKARKFYYFLLNDFPAVKKIISYGSNQSNAMYSLSVLSKLKNWEFVYYVDHIPSYLKENPNGNYLYALKNNMKIIEDEVPKEFENDTLFISEGGAIKEAEFGIKILADEIKQWIKESKIEDIKIFLPSGTGTTALYLQKNLDVEVCTCACVGDEDYLKAQFSQLEDEKYHPTIIKTDKKYHFGKLYKENYELYLDLKNNTNIEFDLLYDCIGIRTVLQNFEDDTILYIHQGGILGNETMSERYLRKYYNK